MAIELLVGGLEHDWIIFHFVSGILWAVILPIDELIFFKMVKTTDQIIIAQKIRFYMNSVTRCN